MAQADRDVLLVTKRAYRTAHYPAVLLTVTQAACVEEESVAGRIIKRAEGPALAGMLRSECYRLGLSALAEQLSLLFRQYPQPGIRESLMLLCWCELVKGIEPEAWYALHLLLPATLKKWINTRQKSSMVYRH